MPQHTEKTAWYNSLPSLTEREKSATKHLPMDQSTDWHLRWIAGFTTQQGRLFKLLTDMSARHRTGDTIIYDTEWCLFLAAEVASWLELLADMLPRLSVEEESDLHATLDTWAKRHSTLPPLTPRLARILAEMREKRYIAHISRGVTT